MSDLDLEQVHKRNFLLMVSPTEGQHLSSLAGFSTPSKEVQEAETIDVIAAWITLAASGALKHVQNASSWLTDFVLQQHGIDTEHRPQILSAYYSYGVALISYLLNTGVIDLFAQGDSADNIKNFVDFIPNNFSVINPYEDDPDE